MLLNNLFWTSRFPEQSPAVTTPLYPTSASASLATDTRSQSVTPNTILTTVNGTSTTTSIDYTVTDDSTRTNSAQSNISSGILTTISTATDLGETNSSSSSSSGITVSGIDLPSDYPSSSLIPSNNTEMKLTTVSNLLTDQTESLTTITDEKGSTEGGTVLTDFPINNTIITATDGNLGGHNMTTISTTTTVTSPPATSGENDTDIDTNVTSTSAVDITFDPSASAPSVLTQTTHTLDSNATHSVVSDSTGIIAPVTGSTVGGTGTVASVTGTVAGGNGTVARVTSTVTAIDVTGTDVGIPGTVIGVTGTQAVGTGTAVDITVTTTGGTGTSTTKPTVALGTGSTPLLSTATGVTYPSGMTTPTPHPTVTNPTGGAISTTTTPRDPTQSTVVDPTGTVSMWRVNKCSHFNPYL